MQIKYYQVTGAKLRRQIEEYHAKQIAAFTLRERIARRLGASRAKDAIVQFAGRNWGIRKFKQPPNEKTWRYDKDLDCWFPRRGRAQKAILEEMYCPETVIPDGWALADIIKYKPMQDMQVRSDGRLGYRVPNLRHFTVDGTEYWIIDGIMDKAPAGCKRISDIRFEQLQAKAEEK